MIYKVGISQQAEEDLRCIYEYIAFELQTLQNAKGQLNRLEERIMGLEQFYPTGFAGMIMNRGTVDVYESCLLIIIAYFTNQMSKKVL